MPNYQKDMVLEAVEEIERQTRELESQKLANDKVMEDLYAENNFLRFHLSRKIMSFLYLDKNRTSGTI